MPTNCANKYNNKDKSINAKEINDHKNDQQNRKRILRKDNKTDKHLARLMEAKKNKDTNISNINNERRVKLQTQ